MLETLFITGGSMAETAGGSFIPHVLTVQIGEVINDSLKNCSYFRFVLVLQNCSINVLSTENI